MTDPAAPSARGRIYTFYSFKGGVGRTMAVANAAFLAAAEGKSVLVMDWDLEAPGLAYHFRGMQEGAGTTAIRNAPGVLDLVWDWTRKLRSNPSPEDLDALSAHYRQGIPFIEATRPLVDDYVFENHGRIDIIGPGRPRIETIADKQASYEDALSAFDWTAFLTEEAGGSLLTALRDWARANYDLVLIDSRTGFADVAGVCTMQLPDVVVLCFVYNRQNIDGVARVAGTIRERRGADVALRAAPMRTAREDTQEESAARARARKELIHRGGFSAEQLDHDFERLAIRAAPNVPFYETVAPIAASRARTDQLALDYLGFASDLFAVKLEVPELSSDWVDQVRRLLQPREVTTDYVLKLRSTDPSLAHQEVMELLRNAFANDLEGADEDYLAALIEVATQIARATHEPFDAQAILSDTVDLLRLLAEERPGRWQEPFALQIVNYLDVMGNMLDDEEELLLLDEADVILAGNERGDIILARIANRRRASRIHLQLQHKEAAEQSIKEFLRLLGQRFGALPKSDWPEEALAAEVDSHVLRGDLALAADRAERALVHYAKGLKQFDDIDAQGRPELSRLRYDLHSRIARSPSPYNQRAKAARHALLAFEWIGNSTTYVVQYLELAHAVTRALEPDLAVEFILKSLGSADLRAPHFASYYGRQSRNAQRFVDRATDLADLAQRSRDPRAGQALRTLVEMVVRISSWLLRRVAIRADADIATSVERFAESIQSRDAELDALLARLRSMIFDLQRTFSRRRPNDSAGK